MFALPNFVQSYKKCSLSQKLFTDPKICSLSSNFVPSLKKCSSFQSRSHFQKMFTIRNNVRIAKFCSELQKMFPFSKIVHRSKNMFAFFKFCSKFQKMFAFSIFRLKFYEMFLFCKICSTLKKTLLLFKKNQRSKNVQHFKKIIRYFWNCLRSKKDTGFENELRFSCKKRMNCVRTSIKV